ncbi:MAG TPA: sugar transferase [bacterium]|nr:sugar transferase [bacterium]
MVFSDTLSTIISIILTYWIRVNLLEDTRFVTPFLHDITTYLWTIPFVCILWVFIFSSKGLYRPRRGISGMGEFREIVRAITFGVVIIMAASFLRKFDYSRLIVLSFWVCNIVLVGSSRASIRYFQRKRMKKGYGKTRVIIVGAGETATLIIDRMKRAEDLGYQIIGIVDDDKSLSMTGTVLGLPFLGYIHQLPQIIDKFQAKEVFFAKPNMDHDQILNIVAGCEETETSFRIVSDLFGIMTGKTEIDNVADTPIIDLTGPRTSALRHLSKLVMDFCFAVIILLLSLPLWIIISLAIKLDTKGPVLFKQTRVGEKGKEFTICKFRTMFSNVNTFEHSPTHKKDKRITRVGRVLRRTSLDELPQLLNVINGDMSLVGPRPEMPFIVAQYDRWQRKRLDVKPGITGLWQVFGRKNLPLEQNLQYDFYYIKNRSILMDLIILLKTIKAVIIGKGAY